MYFISEQNIDYNNIIKGIFPGIQYTEDGKVLTFTNVEREYDFLLHGAALTLNPVSVWRISGSDAKDYIHRVSSNDILGLLPDHYRATLFLNDKGKIIDRAVIMDFESDMLMTSGVLYKEKFKSWIERYIISEDIKFEDVSDQYIAVNVYGSQAEGFITFLFGDKSSEFNEKEFIIDSVEGIDTIIIKDNLNEYFFFTLLINSKSLPLFFRYIKENHSVFDVCFAGTKAFDIFRIEKGIPSYPNEISDNFNPYDINLIGDVSFNKGCYIGQEVIARLDTYSTGKRELTGFILDGEISELPAKVTLNGEETVGEITSVTYSKLLNETIGIGPLKKKIAENEELVDFKAGDVKLKIERLPFKI